MLKRGAKVQLTFNIDTADCLTNGTFGEVVDFVRNAAGIIDHIMVKFTEIHQGEQRRAAELKLTALYPGCTAVQRVMFQYSLAKRSKNVANTAKVIQFPLSLCFAATAHRFQGQTFHKPKKVAMDFRTVFQAAQSYVMLSRVQALSQLLIIDSLPDDKFYALHQALEELKRLNKVSVNRNPPSWENQLHGGLRIAALNCHSLENKLTDIAVDHIILFSDIICLSETWIESDIPQEHLEMHGYEFHLNSQGKGKGIATYHKLQKAEFQEDVKKPKFQLSKLSTQDFDIINVYRSSGGDMREMINNLKGILHDDKNTIIVGDFNLCMIKERNNAITKYLEQVGFTQYVTMASHLEGGHIDHVYSNIDAAVFDANVNLYSPYYT